MNGQAVFEGLAAQRWAARIAQNVHQAPTGGNYVCHDGCQRPRLISVLKGEEKVEALLHH
jgi:hypothetical protein